MFFPVYYLIKITILVILCEKHLVLGAIKCFKGEESEENYDENAVTDPIDESSFCFLIDITTNETFPYFEPTSTEDPLNVTTIDVRSSTIPLLTSEFCKVFPNTNHLNIFECSLRKIMDGALNLCKNLTHFNIFKNELTEVSPYLFTNNPEMIEISFQFNNLTYLDVKLFEPIQKLVRLILGNNLLIHLDLREMPLLQNLTELYIDGNNLLDLDEQAVVEKFPNLINFAFNENLLECRNLNLLTEVVKDKNITLIGFVPRKRISPFSFVEEQGMKCLDRNEHLRATTYFFNEIRSGATPKNVSCSVKTERKKNENLTHITIIQFVTCGLIFFCVSMLIWHAFYWQVHLSSLVDDKGDYYYCNYVTQNVGQENEGKYD